MNSCPATHAGLGGEFSSISVADALGTDGGNLHGGRLLTVWRSSTTTSWHSDAVQQGPSTPSTPHNLFVCISLLL
jgi:hypothetical protein